MESRSSKRERVQLSGEQQTAEWRRDSTRVVKTLRVGARFHTVAAVTSVS